MPLWQPLNDGPNVAIAECPRCHFKRNYTDLQQDPNDGNWYCRFGCVDLIDPWRLPSRRTEDISLDHARPREELEEKPTTPFYPPNTQTAENS